MASSSDQSDPKSSVKGRSVMDRSDHDRDLGNDPTMKRLKEMIDAGEIDQERLIKYLEEEGHDENRQTKDQD